MPLKRSAFVCITPASPIPVANVDLAQSQLLLIQAQNNLQASYADLTRALGFAGQRRYNLVEQAQTPARPMDLTRSLGLIQQAMMNRPELALASFLCKSRSAAAGRGKPTAEPRAVASISFDSVSAVVINALRKHKRGKQRLTLPS